MHTWICQVGCHCCEVFYADQILNRRYVLKARGRREERYCFLWFREGLSCASSVRSTTGNYYVSSFTETLRYGTLAKR